MATARGANTRLLAKEESAYGTNPGGTDWRQFGFNPPLNFGATEPLSQSPTIGLHTGRDPSAPFREDVTVGLSFGLPMDTNDIGFWLQKVFGDPVTTDDTGGDFTHVFKSGTASILPSFSAEVGMPDVTRCFLFTGCRANTLGITARPGGRPTVTLGVVAQDEAESGTSVDAAPTLPAGFTEFDNYQAELTREATALSYATEFVINFSNNVEGIRDIGSGRNIREAQEQDTSISGTLTERLAATTLLADAVAATTRAFVVTWTISATLSLSFALPKLSLERVGKVVPGRGGVSIPWRWQAERTPPPAPRWWPR